MADCHGQKAGGTAGGGRGQQQERWLRRGVAWHGGAPEDRTEVSDERTSVRKLALSEASIIPFKPYLGAHTFSSMSTIWRTHMGLKLPPATPSPGPTVTVAFLAGMGRKKRCTQLSILGMASCKRAIACEHIQYEM